MAIFSSNIITKNRKKSIIMIGIVCLSTLAIFFAYQIIVRALVTQSPDPNLWVTDDNTIFSSAISGNTLYIGGSFNYVGPRTGHGAIFDTNTHQLQHLDYINSWVLYAIPDGAGGWYASGYFDKVGGHDIWSLAHINPDGTLDQNFDANIDSADGNEVDSMVKVGNVLYIDGFFQIVDGQVRNYFAALDATTGALLDWNPEFIHSGCSGCHEIYTLYASGTTLYVGGFFDEVTDGVGGSPISQASIAAWDVTDPVNPTLINFAPDIEQSGHWANVESIAQSGNTLYVGGGFNTINGTSGFHNLAALDATDPTGAPTSWQPNVSGAVTNMTLDSIGNRLYIAGQINTVDGNPRHQSAAYDISTLTPTLTGWAPSTLSFSGNFGGIDQIAVVNGKVLLVGDFSLQQQNTLGGNIMLTDPATGARDNSWDLHADWEVFTVAVQGSDMFLGGYGTSFGGVERNGVAAIDLTTGAATSWNPNVDGDVTTIAVSGNTVFIGSGRYPFDDNSAQFSNAGGQPRTNLAAIDAGTGLATSWDPEPSGEVTKLYVSHGFLYVGGPFCLQIFCHLVRYHLNDMSLDASWDPEPDFNTTGNPPSFIGDMAMSADGNTLYVGGEFAEIGDSTGIDTNHPGVLRDSLAGIDTTTGLATNWDPEVMKNGIQGQVHSMFLQGTTMYIGGDFDTAGGQGRNYLAALDTTVNTNNATNWDPEADNTVHAIVSDGTNFYVGGNFTQIGIDPHNNLAYVDASTGLADTWDVNIQESSLFGDGNGDLVDTLQFSGALFVGGAFQSMGFDTHPTDFYQAIGEDQPSLAQFGTFTPASTPTVGFSATSGSGSETLSPVNLTITLSAQSASDVTVDYAVTGGTAVSGVNYILAPGTVTISAGNTATTVPMIILDDNIVDGDTTVIVTLTNPTNATLNANDTFTYTITNADVAPPPPPPPGSPPPSTPPGNGPPASTTPPIQTPPAPPAAPPNLYLEASGDNGVTWGNTFPNTTLVSLEAIVTHYSSNDQITYRFYCHATDSSPAKIVVTQSVVAGSGPVCAYPDPGPYLVKVNVTGPNLDLTADLTIYITQTIHTPLPPPPPETPMPPVTPPPHTTPQPPPPPVVVPASIPPVVAPPPVVILPTTPPPPLPPETPAPLAIDPFSIDPARLTLGNVIATGIISPVSAFIVSAPVLSVLFAGIAGLSDLWLLFVRAWQNLLSVLGLRRKRKYWGTVYDSVTKQPIDPAIVELIDVTTGKVVEESITDMAGRFGFLARKGRFRLQAAKTHYQFPTQRINGTEDGIFDHVYHGEIFEIGDESQVVAPNIPMDPLQFDWNQQDKQRIIKFHPMREKFKSAFFSTLFFLSCLYSLFICLYYPTTQEFILLAVNIVFIIMYIELARFHLWGRIYHAFSLEPLEGALVELKSEKFKDTVLGKALSASDGKFFLKGNPGRYILSVSYPNPAGREIEVLTKQVVVGKVGLYNHAIPV